MGDEDSISVDVKNSGNKNILFQMAQPPLVTTVPAEPSEFLTKVPILSWTASLHGRLADLMGQMISEL